MTSFLYYSLNSKLSEEEKLIINQEVIKRRVSIIQFLKKLCGRGKIIVISTVFGVLVLVSNSKNTENIDMLVESPVCIVKYSPKIVSRYEALTVKTQNKIGFLKTESISKIDKTYSDLSENHINTVNKIVKLRGGSMTPLTKVLFKIILFWAMNQGHKPATGFQPGPGFGHGGQVQPAKQIGPKIGPRTAPKLQKNPLNENNPRQRFCKQDNENGVLTKEQRRNLPSPEDVIISEQNVIIRHGQAKHKIKDHGYDLGIESRENSKGKFKTERTPENVQLFTEKITHLVLNGERIESTYRIAEPDGYPADHFYDSKTGINAVFKKETNEFVSAWKLSQGQIDDLLNNQNVGDY